MKLISNGTGSYPTGDAIADAVVEYGVTLASSGRAAAVTIPYRGADSGVATLTMTIGAGSPLSVRPADVAADIIDEQIVKSLKRRTQALTPHGNEPLDASDLTALDDYAA